MVQHAVLNAVKVYEAYWQKARCTDDSSNKAWGWTESQQKKPQRSGQQVPEGDKEKLTLRSCLAFMNLTTSSKFVARSSADIWDHYSKYDQEGRLLNEIAWVPQFIFQVPAIDLVLICSEVELMHLSSVQLSITCPPLSLIFDTQAPVQIFKFHGNRCTWCFVFLLCEFGSALEPRSGTPLPSRSVQ